MPDIGNLPPYESIVFAFFVIFSCVYALIFSLIILLNAIYDLQAGDD